MITQAQRSSRSSATPTGTTCGRPSRAQRGERAQVPLGPEGEQVGRERGPLGTPAGHRAIVARRAGAAPAPAPDTGTGTAPERAVPPRLDSAFEPFVEGLTEVPPRPGQPLFSGNAPFCPEVRHRLPAHRPGRRDPRSRSGRRPGRRRDHRRRADARDDLQHPGRREPGELPGRHQRRQAARGRHRPAGDRADRQAPLPAQGRRLGRPPTAGPPAEPGDLAPRPLRLRRRARREDRRGVRPRLGVPQRLAPPDRTRPSSACGRARPASRSPSSTSTCCTAR